jgi:predicted RNA-binding Zn-ribbon protein involved in translation (DUF1610 family)
MKKPKVLFYDIESTPNLAYVWGKYEQDVLAYKKERELLCFAYKWQGEKTVKVVSRQGQKTDALLVIELSQLLNEADICIAHNGDDFDRKIVKSRMFYWRMKPLKPNCSVDTKKIAKTYFSFNGNSLADLARILKLPGKLPHPGFDMWLGCMRNDAKYWKLMLKYNKRDVTLLEAVYDKLKPWAENHPSFRKWKDKGRVVECPKCGSNELHKRGTRASLNSISQVYQCSSCASWTHGKYNP